MGNKKIEYESIKVNKEVVVSLREHKDKTGVPISVFIERLVKKALTKNTNHK